jgi:outer membrane protein
MPGFGWIKAVLCLFFLSLIFASAAKAGQEIWVVDLDRAMSFTSEGKAVLAGIMEKADASETELRALAKEVDILRKDLNVGGMLFSPEARQEKKRQLKKKMRTLKRRQRKSLLEINQAKEEALARLKGQMLKLLSKMASANQIALVFPAEDLLYFSSAVDITDQLVFAFNRLESKDALSELNPKTK